MNKILVLGASGMAGHVISTHLKEVGNDVVDLASRNKLDESTLLLDLTDQIKLKELLMKHDFNIIVNCVGVLIAKSEERKDLSSYLNSFLPHFLENHYKNTPTRVIHLSTDCVFSGYNAPYLENSNYDGTSFYDRSKALGEIINDKDLTFRMSIIGPDMHPEGVGLMNWLMAQKGTIRGFTEAIWSGITTIELAKGISSAIENNLTGVYHLVPDNNISKYDLLRLIANEFNLNGITVEQYDTPKIDKTLVNTRNDFNYKVSDYPAMISDMKVWVSEHYPFYTHYEKN